MRARDFLENLRYVAEAPRGVARLRELILQLAVTGDLVEQREAEGSAEIALEVAQRRRDTYRQKYRLRSRRASTPKADQQEPFPVP
jgi:type I restriction enzyme S subunit